MAASLATLLVGQARSGGLGALRQPGAQDRPLPSATQAQLARIIGELETSQPDRETDLGPVLQSLAEQVKQRGLVIIISDLLTDLDAFYDGLARLQYRGHEIMMLHVLDSDEIDLPFTTWCFSAISRGARNCTPSPGHFAKPTAPR